MRSLIFLLAFISSVAFAIHNVKVVTLGSAQITTGAGAGLMTNAQSFKTCQASGTVTASTGATAVDIQGSNDNVNWVKLGTITLVLGTSSVTDGFVIAANWKYVRNNVVSISGTNAAVTTICSYEEPI